MRRSVEVLSIRQHSGEMHVLLGLYVQSTRPNSSLGILHRGNAEAFLLPAWPLPLHPDEKGRARVGVLEQIYGSLFQEREGEIYQVRTLTAWDNAFDIAHQHPVAWPIEKSERYTVDPWGWKVRPETPQLAPEEYAPFTSWKLGPFPEATSYLVTFTLRMRGKTYHELVDNAREFTVEGPEHLLSRIKYDLDQRYSCPERK